ncbi:MAG: hypothetical protein ACK5Z0_06740, partial [Planctomycetota bacterium]
MTNPEIKRSAWGGLVARIGLLIALVVGSPFALAPSSLAAWQEDDPNAQRTQLGEQQRLVERKMAELEARFTAIALQLQEKEPERAQRLVTAYQQAKERLLTQKMAEVAKLLDANQYAAARAKLDEVITSLDELVKLLINQQDQGLSKQKEMEMLQEWKETLQGLQQEQKQQRQETEKVANKDDALKKLDEQLQRLDGLIKEQSDVIGDTEKNAGKGLQALDKVADKQFDVRKKTEQLKKDVAGESGDPKSDKNEGEQSGEQSQGGENGQPGKSGEKGEQGKEGQKGEQGKEGQEGQKGQDGQ